MVASIAARRAVRRPALAQSPARGDAHGAMRRSAIGLGLLCSFGAAALGCGKLRLTLDLLNDRHPSVLYSVETEEPAVALTIDDGPDPASTPLILDVLERNGARATFFLISDRIEGNESLVEAIVAAGHELGNHMTRDRPSIDLAPGAFARALSQSHEALSVYSTPRWFRPGSGWHDQRMLDVAEDHGYRVALGTRYPLDAQLPSSWFATQFILWRLEPGEVIILHDAEGRGERTARTLEVVLPELQGRGVRVVSLSGLAELEGASTGER